MSIEIGKLRKEDYKKAIEYAIKGMHFDWYLDSKLLLKLYGKYFWYLEMNRATQIFAAYVDGEFGGVLLAEIDGEAPVHHSVWECAYVKVFDFLQKTFYKGGAGLYDETIKEMLKVYRKTNSPDGEIIFLAADPDIKVKGIGTALLHELENREKGKTIYLFTDNACTYQFYEHRGFERAVERDITLDMGNKKKVPLKCFLFSQTIGGESE